MPASEPGTRGFGTLPCWKLSTAGIGSPAAPKWFHGIGVGPCPDATCRHRSRWFASVPVGARRVPTTQFKCSWLETNCRQQLEQAAFRPMGSNRVCWICPGIAGNSLSGASSLGPDGRCDEYFGDRPARTYQAQWCQRWSIARWMRCLIVAHVVLHGQRICWLRQPHRLGAVGVALGLPFQPGTWNGRYRDGAQKQPPWTSPGARRAVLSVNKVRGFFGCWLEHAAERGKMQQRTGSTLETGG